MTGFAHLQSNSYFYVSVVIVLLSLLFYWPRQTLLNTVVSLPSSSTTALVANNRTGVSYLGITVSGVEHFQNIFYAEDTAGNNRFAPPVPSLPAPGTVIDATAAGAWCPQGAGSAPLPFASVITNVSENCLSLRIARPSGTKPSAKLPVMVWLHGGGHALGSASDRLYRPDGLIKLASATAQPIIYVGINYRLGMFGFATNKALRDARQLNAGLRDQRAAFECETGVRDNIAAFGGDSGSITAIGQSVGSSDIGLHLVSYGGHRGVPFQKAIMMSGAPGLNFGINSDLVAKNTAAVAKALNCVKDDPDSGATLACLREAPFEKLMNLSVDLSRQQNPPFGEGVFQPTVDGYYIVDRPSVCVRKGNFVKGIPILASWVTNEGAWYAPPTANDDTSVVASFTTGLLALKGTTANHLLSLYPISDFEHMVRPSDTVSPQYYRAAQINRDFWFTCPALDFTWQYFKRGGSSNIRFYEMNQTRFEPIWKMMGVPHWRVAHLSDIPYILNGDVEAGGDNSPKQRQLAALLSGSAAAFANSADPNKILQEWPTMYEGNSNAAMTNDFPEQITVNIIGGQYGTGPACIAKYGKVIDSDRARALLQEKLFERCEFINSAQVREEIGV